MRLDQSDYFLRIVTGEKNNFKSNSSACEIYEYGHLGHWYIKTNFLCKKFLN